MRLIKGTFNNGQLVLDEPVETTKPVRVVVTFLDEDDKPKGKIDFSTWPSRSLGDDSGTMPGRPKLQFNLRPMGISDGETFRREDMYGDDMR